METAPIPVFDPFDPARLRLPSAATGGLSTPLCLPRHRRGEAFLKGPIPHAWIRSACRLPGSGLHVALCVRFLRDRYGRADRYSIETIASCLGLSESTSRRGLHAAEEAGLLSASREPGCKPALDVLDGPALYTGDDKSPLYGPIPASWLLPALRLPGAALRVAVASWVAAGRERAAEFELALGEWAELGLSRQAAGRGLDSLGSASLVCVTSRLGRSPIVLIVDPPSPPA